MNDMINDLMSELKVKIIDVLNLPDITPDDIGEDDPLVGSDLGIDSIDVLEMVIMIEKDYEVIIDNKGSEEYNLISGEKLDLEASAGFNLLIGNAGGLELEFNGKPLKIEGKAGEVVNIQLP